MADNSSESKPRLASVTVVLPVKNEAETIEKTLGGVLDQTYAGSLDIVLVDGGSTDDTVEVARSFVGSDAKIRFLDNPVGTAPAAMNLGIASTDADVVVRCDGHSVLPPDYIELAVELLNVTGADNVGGIQKAVGTSPTQRAIAAAMSSASGVGDARFRRGGKAGPVDTVYLGTFRRRAVVDIGMFDESMVRNQDYELNHRIRASGGTVHFDPRLVVEYEPRPTLRSLWSQYFDYGRGKRAMLRRHPDSLRWRQTAPILLVGGLILSAVLALTGPRGAALVIPVVYSLFLVASTLVQLVKRRDLAILRLPAVLATMHLAWGVGFLFGRRLRQK